MSFEKFVSLSSKERTDLLSKTWGETSGSFSPSEQIDAVVGYDSEGWEIWETFQYWDVVLFAPWKDESPKMHRIVGFLKDNSVLLRPHGLGHDPLYAGFTARPEGLSHLPKPEPVFHHKDGLVSFS
jgi:hypothetical protein